MPDGIINPMKRIMSISSILLILLATLDYFMESPLFGYMTVNPLLSLIHFASGAGLIWAGMKGIPMMKMVSRSLGILYLILAVWGYGMNGDFFDLMRLNVPDNVFHLLLAAAFLYHGFWWKPPVVSEKKSFGEG
jgi:hypothetical protein